MGHFSMSRNLDPLVLPRLPRTNVTRDRQAVFLCSCATDESVPNFPKYCAGSSYFGGKFPVEMSLHTPQCENNCPIWHVDPRVRNFIVTARLLQLSQPKQIHPDYRSNRESAASIVSFASRTAPISQRLAKLSLPKLKRSDICRQLGHFDEPIWTVSGAAKKASASVHVEKLAAPKQFHKDHIPPQEPMPEKFKDQLSSCGSNKKMFPEFHSRLH